MAQTNLINLDKQTRETLKGLEKKAIEKGKKRVLNRVRAVVIAAEGGSLDEIMKRLNIKTRPTVQRCLEKFKEKGIAGLYDRPHPLPPSRLTQTQKAELLKRYTSLPRVWGGKMGLKEWSYRGLSHWVKDQWGVTLSYERIRQIFQRERENNSISTGI